MRHQIDDSVSNELNEVLSDQTNEPGGLQSLVQGMARHSSGFYYLLQDPDRVVLAGNLPPVDPQVGIREWSGSVKRQKTPYSGIRGQGVDVAGKYLFVGWSTYQLNEMEEFVADAFLWGLAASIVLALTGGIVMSGRLMRKIETVSETSRNIIKGDLKQRVPVHHGGDEFDHLALSINSMLDRIETLMEDLRQVTTDIAHDLRTPLTRLRNRLELALHPNSDERAIRDIVSAARRETDVILEIFGALLRIAQIESGARKSGFAVVSVRDVLDTVVEIYRSSAEEKHHVVEEAVEEGLATLGDRELLTQLFANLIENAIRHSPPGARISVGARSHSRRIDVSVADDGPGIPEPLRDKVLQRFFRLESSRTTPGSGLGLSLAAAIAHLHDASMTLSDNAPGLRVTVSLSRA
jgi:signal transduction histidine kinase